MASPLSRKTLPCASACGRKETSAPTAILGHELDGAGTVCADTHHAIADNNTPAITLLIVALTPGLPQKTRDRSLCDARRNYKAPREGRASDESRIGWKCV
jgi:hypothetical protein